MRAMVTMSGASKDTGSKHWQTNLKTIKKWFKRSLGAKRSAIGAAGVHYLWGQAVVMVGCILLVVVSSKSRCLRLRCRSISDLRAVAYEHCMHWLSFMKKWQPFTWPANWGINNFKTLDESRISKAGNLLLSLCLAVKSAWHPGTQQKNDAAIFRRRFACCWLETDRASDSAFSFKLDASGWLVLPVGSCQCQCTGTGVGLGCSPKLYHDRRINLNDHTNRLWHEGRKRLTWFKLLPLAVFAGITSGYIKKSQKALKHSHNGDTPL